MVSVTCTFTGLLAFANTRNPGANAMDGVVGVTQCAIAHNHNFTYRFTLDDKQHGTYWYVLCPLYSC